MAKKESNIYRIHEVKDNLVDTREKMLKGINDEQHLIDVLKGSTIGETEIAKNLVEQTEKDIENRRNADEAFTKKIEACDKLIAMHEKDAELVDDVLNCVFDIFMSGK